MITVVSRGSAACGQAFSERLAAMFLDFRTRHSKFLKTPKNPKNHQKPQNHQKWSKKGQKWSKKNPTNIVAKKGVENGVFGKK